MVIKKRVKYVISALLMLPILVVIGFLLPNKASADPTYETHCDDITTPTTWAGDTTHVLNCGDIEITSTGSLTIEPGAVVKAASYTNIVYVTGGSLTADGVTFTSTRDHDVGVPLMDLYGASWPVQVGGQITPRAGASVTITNSTFRYFRGMGNAPYNYASSVTITNSTIEALTPSAYLTELPRSIWFSTFSANLSSNDITDAGVQADIANTEYYTGTSNVIISDNTLVGTDDFQQAAGSNMVYLWVNDENDNVSIDGNIFDNVLFPMSVPGIKDLSNVPLIGTDANIFSGSNSMHKVINLSGVEVPLGKVVHLPEESVAIYDNASIKVFGELVVDSGAVFKHTSLKAPIEVNTGGVVTINGTQTNPVTVTDKRDDTVGGDITPTQPNITETSSSSSPGSAINIKDGGTVNADYLNVKFMTSYAIGGTSLGSSQGDIEITVDNSSFYKVQGGISVPRYADLTVKNTEFNFVEDAAILQQGDYARTWADNVTIQNADTGVKLHQGWLSFRGMFIDTDTGVAACNDSMIVNIITPCFGEVLYTYWGSDDGPTPIGTGAVACGNILVKPFLDSTGNTVGLDASTVFGQVPKCGDIDVSTNSYNQGPLLADEYNALYDQLYGACNPASTDPNDVDACDIFLEYGECMASIQNTAAANAGISIPSGFNIAEYSSQFLSAIGLDALDEIPVQGINQGHIYGVLGTVSSGAEAITDLWGSYQICRPYGM